MNRELPEIKFNGKALNDIVDISHRVEIVKEYGMMDTAIISIQGILDMKSIDIDLVYLKIGKKKYRLLDVTEDI
jgi:hypothetical protein